MRRDPGLSARWLWGAATLAALVSWGTWSSMPATGGVGEGGGTTITSTTSTDTHTTVQVSPGCSPPLDCVPAGSRATPGSSCTEQSVNVTKTFGPACIGIGDRDLINPSPVCGGYPTAASPVDPFHGTVFLVQAGTENVNINVHAETFQCASSALIHTYVTFVWGLGAFVVGVGAMALRRLRLRSLT